MTTLATVFGFTNREHDELKNDGTPTHTFVRRLAARGLISPDTISDLTDALKANELEGIVRQVQASFDKNLRGKQLGELVHENYPYLTKKKFDFLKKKGDRKKFNEWNEVAQEECEEMFPRYTLGVNNKRVPVKSSEKHLRVMMIGKTGSGKSATANSILGKTKFQEGNTAVSQTTSSCVATCELPDGRHVTVVDSPGLKDTVRSDEAIMEEIARVAYLLRDGVHAFIFVWNAAEMRFTEEAKDVLRKVKDAFGEDYKKHCLFVYTNVRDKLEEASLDDHVSNQRQDKEMDCFLEEMGWRIVAVNSATTIPAEKRRNQESIIGMVDQMVLEAGSVYTNDLFDRAKDLHAKIADRLGKYHPALVAACIEFHDTHETTTLKSSAFHDLEIVAIVGRSKTGSFDRKRNVWELLDGTCEEELSPTEFVGQIWSILRDLESSSTIRWFNSSLISSALWKAFLMLFSKKLMVSPE